jgi:electron transport complex protein RnfE
MYSIIDHRGAKPVGVAWSQFLGLCPILAAADSENALALAAASFIVLVAANATMAVSHRFFPRDIRMPAFMLIAASCATTTALLMQAFTFDQYERIALYAQVVLVNCAMLERAMATERHRSVGTALIDSVITAGTCAAAIIALGGIRGAVSLQLPLAALPPGAFLIAALALAARNALARDA